MRQIWLRHRNGNGKKYGNDCEVSEDTLLDATSSVGDRVEVYDSWILNNSLLSDDAHVSGAHISSSSIRDHVHIVGYSILEISGCDLSGNTRLWQSPKLQDVTLRHVVVFGDAHLVGPWALNDRVRIHRGRWERAPRYHHLRSEQIDVMVSECVEDRFHAGCFCLPYAEWKKKRQRLGARAGWPAGLIEEGFAKMTEWRAD
jgi:hypothetical protein